MTIPLIIALSFCAGMAGGILLMAAFQCSRATARGEDE
jgi:hypothetical protein